MIFANELKIELVKEKEIKAVVEVEYDDIDNAIECAYELLRYLILEGEENG